MRILTVPMVFLILGNPIMAQITNSKNYFKENEPVKVFVNTNFASFYDFSQQLTASELQIDSLYTSDSTKIKFYKILTSLTFKNCTINFNLMNKKNIPFIRMFSDRNISVDSIVFKEKVSFIHTNHRSFYLQNAIFEKNCTIGFIENKSTDRNEKAEIAGSTFNSNLSVFNEIPSDMQEQQYLRKYTYSRRTVNSILSNVTFVNDVFKSSVTIRSSDMKDITFTNSTFISPLILSYKTLDSSVIEKCEFNNAVDLRGIKLLNGSVIKNNYFSKQCNIIIRPNDVIENLSIDNISLQKVFFIIDWDWKSSNLQYVYWDNSKKRFFALVYKKTTAEKAPVLMATNCLPGLKEQNLEQIKLTFQNIKDHVSKTIINDDMFGSGKQKVFSWIDYQQKQYEKLFYKSSGTHIHYYWLCFLELIVNFGYKGEGVFIFYCLIIVSFFALIYRISFVDEIEVYVNDGEIIDKDKLTKLKDTNIRRNKLLNHLIFLLKIINIDFIKSFFASFAIFFTPKFPFKVFKYSNGFSRFVITEWAIGTMFVLLFLYYIAGNYPIVTKLIGF